MIYNHLFNWHIQINSVESNKYSQSYYHYLYAKKYSSAPVFAMFFLLEIANFKCSNMLD